MNLRIKKQMQSYKKMNNMQGDITDINVRLDASTLSVRHGVAEMHSGLKNSNTEVMDGLLCLVR